MHDAQEADYILDCNDHEMYEGERVIVFDGKEYCDDCFRDEIFSLDTFELALLLGAEIVNVEIRGRRYE